METTLTPLTVGGCLSDAFNHVSKQWRAWIGSALVYFGGMFGLIIVLVMPVTFVAVFGAAFVGAASGGQPDSGMMLLLLAPMLLLGLVFFLAMLFIAAIAYLGMARLSLLALRGEPTTYWEVFHYARAPGQALSLFFLVMLITLPLFCLGVIPAIIFGIMALFAPYLMIDRGLSPMEAIQGSIELFRSSWVPLTLLWLALVALNLILSNIPIIGAFAMMLIQPAAFGIAYLQLTGQTIGGLDDVGLPRKAAG
jgi:hypothetical protein